MAGSPHVPDVLRAGPFRSGQGLAAGLTRRQLQSDCWRHLQHDVYAWAGLPDDLGLRVAATALVLPVGAAFTHRTAAWLHGVATISPGPDPVVTVPAGTAFAARDGLVVRHAAGARRHRPPAAAAGDHAGAYRVRSRQDRAGRSGGRLCGRDPARPPG